MPPESFVRQQTLDLYQIQRKNSNEGIDYLTNHQNPPFGSQQNLEPHLKADMRE